MATLEQIDLSHPLELYPYQHDLDVAFTRPVETEKPIILKGADVELFLSWAKQDGWRHHFEEDLQSVAQDQEGKPLLTTWMPLVTFREHFCLGGRNLQDSDTRILMERIREQTKNWRASQVDTVDISGRFIT